MLHTKISVQEPYDVRDILPIDLEVGQGLKFETGSILLRLESDQFLYWNNYQNELKTVDKARAKDLVKGRVLAPGTVLGITTK